MSEDRFKFRIWEINNKKMIYQYEDRLDKFFNKLSFPLHWGNLMQCTGLKDKNGKLIFEGDILKQEHYGCPVVVKHINGIEINGFMLEDAYIMNGVVGKNLLTFGSRRASKSTIVGNIYENPELLDKVIGG